MLIGNFVCLCRAVLIGRPSSFNKYFSVYYVSVPDTLFFDNGIGDVLEGGLVPKIPE